MAETQAAAFFRVEGALLGQRALACAAWMAARQVPRLGRVARAGGVLLASAAARLDPTTDAARLAWRALDGCSEDRLVVLGEDWWREVAEPALNPVGLDLVDRCRRAGDRVVLLSDHPDVAVAPLAARLGADELIANRLEVVRGRCTGRLVPPVVTGRVDGGWLRRYAGRHGLSLVRSGGYGARPDDATLLAAVGRPCAVTPHAALRRLAREHDWPIVEAA